MSHVSWVIQVKACFVQFDWRKYRFQPTVYQFHIHNLCVSLCCCLPQHRISTLLYLCRLEQHWSVMGTNETVRKGRGTIIKRLWQTPASSLVPILLIQSFIMLPSPVNCTPTFLLIFPRAAPCAVLCLLLVWISWYTNLDLCFPLFYSVILSSIDWALTCQPILFITMHCQLKGPVTEDVYYALHMEVLHCLIVKLEIIKQNSLCILPFMF